MREFLDSDPLDTVTPGSWTSSWPLWKLTMSKERIIIVLNLEVEHDW